MLFIALLFGSLCLLTLFVFTKLAVLSFLDTIFWVLFGLRCYALSTQPSTGAWDIYYALFFAGCFFGLACVFLPLIIRPTKAMDKGDVYVDDLEDSVTTFEEGWDRASGGRIPMTRRGRRPPPRQPPQTKSPPKDTNP